MDNSAAPLRIGLVTPYRWTAFSLVNEQVAGLAQQLRLLGHMVTVFAALGASERRYSPDTGTHALLSALDARQQTALDLVHFFEPLASVRTALALARVKRPAIATFYGAKAEPALDGLARVVAARALSRLAYRIAASPAALRLTAARYPGIYGLVRPGIDLARAPAQPASEGAPLRVLCPLPSSNTALVQPLLLDALLSLLTGDGAGQVAFTLAFWQAKAMVPPRTAGPRVSFVEVTTGNELDGLLAQADVLCLGSEDEHSELLVARAMAAGRPVVAPRTPGLRDSIREWHDGLLVPPRDASAFAGALRRLAVDSSLRLRLGLNAHATAARYAWPQAARRLATIYREAIPQARVAA